ncbi:MAG: phosphoribosyltransferase family protein [Geminicoccaceae bacterium]
MLFSDRRDAGRRLGERLARLGLPAPVVLALPRGGVAVAVEVARRLAAPLDLVLVRKLGVHGQEELAAGAVVEGEPPELVLNEAVVDAYGVAPAYLETRKEAALRELARRRRLYLGERSRVPLGGRTAILVDDGIATGATARAALLAVRRRGPRELVLAVPVATPEILDLLAPAVDRLVCLDPDPDLISVGEHYQDFAQVEDEAVIAMLAEARA